MYLFEFSNINSRIKCKICLKLPVELPDVVLVSLLLTLNKFDLLFLCVFAALNMLMTDKILYCLNLNVSMHFKVWSRSPVTFKTKLYVIGSSHYLFFCHKELHLRYCIGLELNIVIWFTCNMNVLGSSPLNLLLSVTLGKYGKLTLLDVLKMHFQRFFSY